MQTLSGDFQHACGKMQAYVPLSVRWCAMCIFVFLRFYNFIKGIVHINIVFLKMLGPLLLYLTYELFWIFITFNRTDVWLFKQVNE